jgi:succinate dehydrogenase / fumarate reductase iron-sulfur subunit
MNEQKVRFRVFRGTNEEGGQLVDYDVPVSEGMVVLDAVLYIQANYAPDLAVRWNCKAAKCGSCSAEINGLPKLMCKTRVNDAINRDGVVDVRPMHAFPLIKDLVTDVSWNYEVNKQIPPFTPADSSDEPWRMQQEDVDRVLEFRKCIECFLCQDVCHVLRDHNGKNFYYGPRFMVRIASLEMHPKDTVSRIKLLRGKAGIGYCNVTRCCVDVCPEHINITDNAIIPLKERVVDSYFDPIMRLFARKNK